MNKTSRYFLSTITDIKEDIIISVMKNMREQNIDSFVDVQNPNINYRIIDEERGGKTIAKCYRDNHIIFLRNSSVEHILEVLVQIEKI